MGPSNRCLGSDDLTDSGVAAALHAARDSIAGIAHALTSVEGALDASFMTALLAMSNCSGAIVTTGVGKSWIAAEKTATTLASLGVTAYSVNASEAVHGHAGGVRPGDVGIAFSASGETPETTACLRLLHARGAYLVGVTCSRAKPSFDEIADVTIRVPFSSDADLMGMVPTASTALLMIVGDALVAAVVSLRGISPARYLERHPGGTRAMHHSE